MQGVLGHTLSPVRQMFERIAATAAAKDRFCADNGCRGTTSHHDESALVHAGCAWSYTEPGQADV